MDGKAVEVFSENGRLQLINLLIVVFISQPVSRGIVYESIRSTEYAVSCVVLHRMLYVM